jgi:N-acetylneuraminic acid mutarotase
VGVYFPANGRFYTMGGRTSDAAGSDLTNVYEFNPATSTWTMITSSTYPDNQVNNMACGVLTDAGTPYIYCVGGSAAGATTATARVFRFNPATGAITAVSAPWPGNTNGAILPGGFAVQNNKLYIIGGFEINVAMTNQTWEFTPGSNTWVQKANLPVARGYVPATTIGNMIYTGGGTDYQASALVDMPESYRFDPVANTWTPIANTPRATGETRAVTLNGEMWVLGGGRTAPNPSSSVEIYNPGSNSWRTGPAFTTARRNFPADSNGTDRIWLVGGYAPSTATNTMEIFAATGGGCPTPGTPVTTNTATRTSTATVPVVPTTAVASNTATRTNTATVPVVPTTAVPATTVVPSVTMTSVLPTATRTTAPPTSTVMATATVCAMNFTDVDQYNPFRIYIRCLYCAGVLSGYSTNPPCTTGTPCFRPYDNVTRGQIAKIVSNAAGINDPAGTQIFVDVPPTHPFYTWINRLARRGILGGYNTSPPCPGAATPCFRPEAFTTRGQMAKIVSNAAGFMDNPPAGTISFTDVPTTNPFWLWIERLARRGIISGYDCGGPGEPCDALRRPYYRPNNFITRGQTSKIVANTFFPSCQPPQPPSTPPARPEGGPADSTPDDGMADN